MLTKQPCIPTINLDELKTHLHVDSTEEDGLISSYYLAAVDYAEQYTGRIFHPTVYTYTLAFPELVTCRIAQINGYADSIKYRIKMPVSPVTSITSVTYTDASGALQTLNPASYALENDQLLIESDTSLAIKSDAISISFTAGYAVIPESIKLSLKLLVGEWFKHRENTVDGVSITEVPLSVNRILDLHRSVGI